MLCTPSCAAALLLMHQGGALCAVIPVLCEREGIICTVCFALSFRWWQEPLVPEFSKNLVIVSGPRGDVEGGCLRSFHSPISSSSTVWGMLKVVPTFSCCNFGCLQPFIRSFACSVLQAHIVGSHLLPPDKDGTVC